MGQLRALPLRSFYLWQWLLLHPLFLSRCSVLETAVAMALARLGDVIAVLGSTKLKTVVYVCPALSTLPGAGEIDVACKGSRE